MVGASDIDTSSSYTSSSSSSSSDDDDDRNKSKKHVSKNFNGLSCFTLEKGFCGMAHSSSSKRSTKDDLDLDSEDEVTDDLTSLCQENEALVALLDNRDDMHREAKKLRKELRALLEDARERVADLESKNLDAKLEIYALKATPVVSDDVDCDNCDAFVADLTVLKEKHASKLEELDVVRAELDVMKPRTTLLGTCTSCPMLHGKLDESHARIVSLEAALKSPLLLLAPHVKCMLLRI